MALRYLEILRLLRITKNNALKRSYKVIEITLSNEDIFRAQILVVPANVVLEIATPKYMVLDPVWFDRDQTKFEDW